MDNATLKTPAWMRQMLNDQYICNVAIRACFLIRNFCGWLTGDTPEPAASQAPIRHNRSLRSLLFRLRLDSFGNPAENIFVLTEKIFFRINFCRKKEATGDIMLYVIVIKPNMEVTRCQPVLHTIHRES